MRFMKNYGRVAHYAPAYAMNDEFSRVLHQQMEFFSSNPSADTLNRVRGEVSEASNFCSAIFYLSSLDHFSFICVLHNVLMPLIQIVYLSFWFLAKVLAFRKRKEIRLLFYLHLFWKNLIPPYLIVLTNIGNCRYAQSWWRTLRRYWREVIGLSFWLTKLQQCKMVHFTSGNSPSAFVERFG